MRKTIITFKGWKHGPGPGTFENPATFELDAAHVTEMSADYDGGITVTTLDGSRYESVDAALKFKQI